MLKLRHLFDNRDLALMLLCNWDNKPEWMVNLRKKLYNKILEKENRINEVDTMDNMDNPIDKRGKLDGEIFSYRITKDKKVFISWHGKIVTTLNGSKAENFISDIENIDGTDAQLIMARVTGHFKHGNEKLNKKRK